MSSPQWIRDTLAGIGVLMLFVLGSFCLTAFVIGAVTGEARPTLLVPAAVSLGGVVLIAFVRWRRAAVAGGVTGIGRGLTDRLLMRTASQYLAVNRKIAPYTTQYRCEDGVWLGEWHRDEEAFQTWTVNPADFQHAYVGREAVYFFHSATARRIGLVWIVAPDHRKSLRASFADSGLSVASFEAE
ncbi:MAG: hypothetical protein ACJAZO_003189 [Myxococcota bacterium]